MSYLDFARDHLADSMSMDVIHARMIGEFIRRIRCFDVVEVGCCHGVSTGAILDALTEINTAGQVPYLVLIDPVIQPAVQAMVREADAKFGDEEIMVVVKRSKSLDTAPVGIPWIAMHCDRHCVLVLDGDHSEETVLGEIDAVLSRGIQPRAVILHDVGLGGLPGPRAGVAALRSEYAYTFAMDDAFREGMRTERGLAILCRDAGDAAVAAEVLSCEKS